MRIDEFSNSANIDGSISATEQSQFLLFGFDLSLSSVTSFFEEIVFNSTIIKEKSFDSQITKTLNFNNPLGD